MQVTEQIYDSFLGNLPVLRFDGVYGRSSLYLAYAGRSLQETYTPDSNSRVYVHGLYEFVRDYIEIDVLTFLQYPKTSIQYVRNLIVSLTDSASGYDQLNVDIYPSREAFSISPTTYRFLTRTNVKTLYDEMLFLSSFGGANKVKYTYINQAYTSTAEDTRSSATGNSLFTFRIDRSNFNDGIVSIKAELYSGNSLVDTIFIDVAPKQRFAKTFVFDNVFFAPETATFRGSEKDNYNFEADFGYIGSKYNRLVDRSTREYVVNSGPLTEDEYRTFLDIASADHVYLVENGTYVPVVVVAFETNERLPKEAPASVTMTYRMSERQRAAITRESEPAGIFTAQFTEVFD